MQMLDLRAQYVVYQKEIDNAVQRVIESGCFIGGDEIIALEKELANYTQAPFAVGCSSGTDALLLALLAVGVQAGDEIITTAFTFVATAEAPMFLGAKPVFVDIDANTFNIDAQKIEKAITKKTKAIIPVSLFGLPAEMKMINDIAERYGLSVIEDAAQSFGAEYCGKKSTNLSSFACSSFFPAKPLGCYGDGGVVFCREDLAAQKIKMYLNHGSKKRYYHDYVGFNGRLDAIQAAILRVKLRHFDDEVKKRRALAERYREQLKGAEVVFQEIPEHCQSVYAQFCFTVSSKKVREDLTKHYDAQKIPYGIYYPIPLHLQRAFQSLGGREKDLPVTEDVSDRILAVPMHAFLDELQQDQVIKATMDFFSGRI